MSRQTPVSQARLEEPCCVNIILRTRLEHAARHIAEKSKPEAVHIEVERTDGQVMGASGDFIGPGMVMTAAHCVDRAVRAVVSRQHRSEGFVGSQFRMPDNWRHEDGSWDFALIVLDTPMTDEIGHADLVAAEASVLEDAPVQVVTRGGSEPRRLRVIVQ